jgi:conjugative transfer region protein (TIGR03750 family)
MRHVTPIQGTGSMTSGADARREITVSFLPHRLNRQPVIVRGLTADELWFSVGVSALIGLVLGVAVAVGFSSLALAPTCVVVCVAAGLFFGGGLLRRHKRGRPDTWLYRHIQWWTRQHAPFACALLGGQDLIVRSGYWSTRRTHSGSHPAPAAHRRLRRSIGWGRSR